jgi:hypothetical protein
MAEIVFYYKHEYRCKLSEEDYNKILKYSEDNEITLEDAYLQLEYNEIDDYMDFANEVNSEFDGLEIKK